MKKRKILIISVIITIIIIVFSINIILQNSATNIQINDNSNVDSKKNNDNAVFRKNTKFTALEIIYQPDSIWSRTPNGYICIQDLEHKYCVRV